ncbi:hypothetical protein LI177_08965 [bacterium 210820-DFI.6.37]|nr:hypothetical protein [bacterium 210820-DFI.6.37]
MKNYYQRKRNGYFLPHEIYKKTWNTIECYAFYKRVLIDQEWSSDVFLEPEWTAVNKATADYYIRNIDAALKEYIPEELRQGIFEHVVYGKTYQEISKEVHLSPSSLKQWTQIFVYGVAEHLGDDFYVKKRTS